MALHTPTLFVCYILAVLTMLAMLLASYREERPLSISLWMYWLSFQAVGFSLYVLRGQISPWFSIVVANVCLAAANSCALAAFLIYFQRQLRPRLLFAPIVAAGIITTVFLDAPLIRVPLITLLYTVLSGLVALIIIRNRGRGDYTSLLVAIPFAFIAFSLLARATSIILDADPGYQLLASSLGQTATLLALILSQLAASFGFVLLHRERTENDIKTLALHDPLTGCLNRRSFQYLMDKEVARLGRGGAQLSLLLADIDHFKVVNDTYGHAAGDAVLVDLVRKAGHVLRSQDFIFRYGGEEFCFLLPRSNRQDSLTIAERIRSTIESGVVHYGNKSIRYTVSIGCTCSHGANPEQSEQMFVDADRAMYAAKQSGRNRVVHSDDLDADTGLERALERQTS